MGFKYPLGFIILFLLCLSSPVQAQIYEPGTGILLPKRQRDKQAEENEKKQKRNAPIQRLNNNNNDTTIVKKGAIIQPNRQGPLVIQPDNTMNKSNDALKLTNAYAAHLYTSVCSQEYRDSLVSFTEQNLDRRKMWADIQVSCKCLTNEIISVIPATELSDYVMYTRGAQASEQMDPNTASYYASGKANQIMQLSSNQLVRKKCGFLN
ncbi:MAG: hypothetical protein DI586_11335 [Micavibrio aeruginosavorus]|uniref:Uncharacterized protein n=1 Tax=Micavibrio aeruginosavorus TaxID=349221 RepID=A0A2W5HHA8_9BACT|nr:MAG: hypothetical protein DI586_11335 [Micavibrio aeruginosavorus]